MDQDIRWIQRFSNFNKALNKLTEAIDYIRENFKDSDPPIDDSKIGFVLDEIVKEGLIHRFEYTHELAWNVMKDYAAYQGNTLVGGSRDATREAYQLQLISDGKLWMDMISSRNKTSHTYNEETATEIYSKIIDDYYSAFLEFKKKYGRKKKKPWRKSSLKIIKFQEMI
ncbi:MAG: nucleotidyltransferase substrate binding protein [Balneolales bacterium]|nr:nucleotidyltransferase substrate binding protein [Balneolales bacterium]